MKLKFFSMMAAACVALFSVSSLTCCSGGGGGGGGEGGSSSSADTAGYLTYDGFTKQMHGIRIEASIHGEYPSNYRVWEDVSE